MVCKSNKALGESAMGRKQPVPVPCLCWWRHDVVRLGTQRVAAISVFLRAGRSYSAKFVAAISKIWWAQPGAAVPFVASIPESHITSLSTSACADTLRNHRRGMPKLARPCCLAVCPPRPAIARTACQFERFGALYDFERRSPRGRLSWFQAGVLPPRRGGAGGCGTCISG
jgi:hypothetical protein